MNLLEIDRLLPQPDAIVQAEQHRDAQRFDRIWRRVKVVERLTPGDLKTIRESEDVHLQRRLLNSALIDVVGMTTRVQKLPFGLLAPVAYTRLDNVLGVHEQLYGNEDFHAIAQTNNESITGNTFNFGLEMPGHSANIFFLAAELLGNPELIDKGIAVIDRAAEEVQRGLIQATDPTALPLLRFNSARAATALGRETWEEEKNAYKELFQASIAVKNLPRAAVINARYLIDSQKKQDDQALQQAVRDREVNELQEQNPTVLQKEILKAENLTKRNALWDRTRRFVLPHVRRNIQRRLDQIQ